MRGKGEKNPVSPVFRPKYFKFNKLSRTELDDAVEKDEKRFVLSLTVRRGMKIDNLHSFPALSPLLLFVAVY